MRSANGCVLLATTALTTGFYCELPKGNENWSEDGGVYDDGDYGSEDAGADEAATAATPVGDECELEWFRWDPSELPITAVCFSGDDPGTPPSDVTVEVPCDNAYSVGPNQYGGEVSVPASNGDDFQVVSAYPPYLCAGHDPIDPDDDASLGGGGTWTARFPAPAGTTCDQYTLGDVNYVLLDSAGQMLEGWGPSCGYENHFEGFFGVGHYDDFPSSNAACTPGTASFVLAARGVSEGPQRNALWLSPLALEPARFPERAWLRRVEVLEWGDLENLHIAHFGHHLRYQGGQIPNGHELLAPAEVLTFPAGAVPMSAMIGAERVPKTTGLQHAVVQLSWSCQVDPQDPHYVVRPEPGWVAELPAVHDIHHRLVLWIDWPRSRMRVAPEGRFFDYVYVHLEKTSPITAQFVGKIPGYGAGFGGRLSVMGDGIHLTDATMEVGLAEFEMDDQILEPL